MDTRRFVSRVILGLVGLIGSASIGSGQVLVHPFDQALANTLQAGRPTVLVASSKADAEAARMWTTLIGTPRYAELSGTTQFVPMHAEANPERIRALGITSTPTVLVYRRGPAGLELAGRKDGVKDAYLVLGWLDTLGLNAPATAVAPATDAAVTRANHPQAVPQASPQQQYQAPPQAAPPPTPLMAVPQPAPVMAVPTISAPAPAPVVVSSPPQPIVFQPQAQTIVVGPTPPTNVVLSAAPSAPPNISLMMPAAPAPPPSMFLAPPAPAAAPAFAVPSQPLYAAAPVQPQAGVGTVALGLVLSNPALLDRILGAIGECLARRGQPRVQMSSSPALVPVQAGIPAMPAGHAMPAPAAPQTGYYAPPPAASPQGPPAVAVPQMVPVKTRHGFRLFHRD